MTLTDVHSILASNYLYGEESSELKQKLKAFKTKWEGIKTSLFFSKKEFSYIKYDVIENEYRNPVPMTRKEFETFRDTEKMSYMSFGGQNVMRTSSSHPNIAFLEMVSEVEGKYKNWMHFNQDRLNDFIKEFDLSDIFAYFATELIIEMCISDIDFLDNILDNYTLFLTFYYMFRNQHDFI